MKRTILSMMLIIATMCGWAADGNNKLKMKIDVLDFGDTLVLYISGKQEQTFLGKDGKFEFEIQVDDICEALLLQPKILRGEMENVSFFKILLVGGEEMRLWQTVKERYDIDGTGFYADYHQVDLYIEEAAKEQNELAQKYREMRNDNSVTNEQRSNYYDNVYMPSFQRYQQKLLDYVKAHSSQEAAVIVASHMGDFEKMKEAYALLDPSVREGRMKVLYEKWVKDYEERLQEEEKDKAAAQKQAPGIEAPAFTLNDLEGKPLSLASLRGKYVVLDFWGSWCIWCIKGFPMMKEYYAKYPGKFEILGVDCNDTEEKWKAAVKKHELPWLHVYCPESSTLLSDYGVTGFPTKIIIGPDGKIVKTIVGEDPSFYTLLDELFNH